MGREFDVVVVGGRCVGSPLAALLARAGLSVALVEQARFPRDTLSTHTFQSAALAFLGRLGVLSAVRATGAPVVNHLDLRQEEFRARVPWPRRPGEAGGVLSVRRLLLDPILMEAALGAGAEVWMGAKVTALVRDRGRVTGVRVARNGSEHVLGARLVVGADGRHSTVAKLAGSRKYHLTANERFMYWSFFAGVDPGGEPTGILHRWSGNFVVAMPADSGLYLVLALPGLSELPRFRHRLEESYLEYACRCDPVAHALSGARRVGKLFGMLRWEGFFREATGPGWILAGDAGHFKDPAPGQGIQDAFRQAESLASAIPGAISTSPSALDEALAGWARWRDEDAAEHYWLAADFGKAGMQPRSATGDRAAVVPARQDGLTAGSVQPPLRALQGAFASATLINTGVLTGYRWHRYARIWRTPGLGEVFQATTSRPAFRLLLGRENPRLTRDQIDRIYDASRSWATKRAVLKLYRATPAAKLAGPAAALRPLDRPALVIWGTKDAYLPREQAERQRQAFPSAQIEMLDGHGHWVMLEDPGRVASLVIPFLARQLPGPATGSPASPSPGS